MDMIGRIRRLHSRDKKSEREIARLTRGACGHRAIRGDAMGIHDAAKFAECFRGFAQRLAVKFAGGKNGMAQANRSAQRFDHFPIVG